MTDRPILFSAPMIRAILDGRKLQTRRLLKPQPPHDVGQILGPGLYYPTVTDCHGEEAPGPPVYGVCSECGMFGTKLKYAPGDRLWVRETWRAGPRFDDHPPRMVYGDIIYEADDRVAHSFGKLRPSIFMPRWASRITLIVENVKVERLQSISEADAIAEGSSPVLVPPDGGGAPHIEGFRDLWTSIHGIDSWENNPWVAAISFRVILVPRLNYENHHILRQFYNMNSYTSRS